MARRLVVLYCLWYNILPNFTRKVPLSEAMFMDFKLVSDYQPSGDQPEAIEKLTQGLKKRQHLAPSRKLLGALPPAPARPLPWQTSLQR